MLIGDFYKNLSTNSKFGYNWTKISGTKFGYNWTKMSGTKFGYNWTKISGTKFGYNRTKILGTKFGYNRTKISGTKFGYNWTKISGTKFGYNWTKISGTLHEDVRMLICFLRCKFAITAPLCNTVCFGIVGSDVSLKNNYNELFLFHCNSGYVNTPQCDVLRTLSVLQRGNRS